MRFAKLKAMQIQRMLLRKTAQISLQLMRKLGGLSEPMIQWQKRLCVIGETSPVPELPFICCKKVDTFSIFCAIERTILNLEEKARQALFVKRVIRIDSKQFLEMPSLKC